LVVKYGLDRLREMVGLFLGTRQNIDWTAWRDKKPEDLTVLWEKFFNESVFPSLLEEITESPDSHAVRKIAEISPCPCNHKTMQERLAVISETLPKISGEDGSAAVLAQLEILRDAARAQGGGTKKNWADEDLYNQFRDAAAAIRKNINSFKKTAAFDAAASLPVAQMAMRLVQLSETIALEYEREKQTLGVLDFDDLLIYARRLLVGPERKPLRRRWAEQLRLLLVDEFQDTDPLQVELVKALCDNEVTRGKLFFVGDFKQSIYRFRGADPHVFRLLRDEIPAQGRLPLSENFRSQPGVIEFVNALFHNEFDGYEPLRAHRVAVTTPAVEFLWATDDANENCEQGHPRPLPNESPSTQDLTETEDDSKPAERNRRREADWIARRIRQMLDGKEKLVGDKDAEKNGTPAARPVKQGDIAILFRALTNVQYYEEALRSYGIDYYLVGGHAFYAQQEVYDLLNLLRALESQCDDIALLGVLRSPFFCLLDETIFWLGRHPQGLRAGLFSSPLPPELEEEQAARVKFTADTLRELHAMKDRLPIAQLIRLALDRTAYDAILLGEFLGERKLANLYKLIDQARSFDESGVFSLADFITQLSEFVVRQPKEPLAATQAESMDVVRLMSIHQSKGLEFPVVFVADLERRLGSQPTAAAFSPELGPLVKDAEIPSGFNLYMRAEGAEDRAETVRLFYVAATRAADYLVLAAGITLPLNDGDEENGKKKDAEYKPKGEWMQLLTRHFDLFSGRPTGLGNPAKVTAEKPTLEKLPDDVAIHVRLKKILEKTEKAVEENAAWPPYLLPVAVDPSARLQMSFSRLSGKLHREISASRDVPVSGLVGLDAASPPAIDPLGLGTLVHAVLEEVDFARPENAALLAERHALEHVGDDKNAVAQAVEMLERFLQSARAKEIAAAKKIHRELEFLLAWPPEGERNAGQYFQGFLDLLYQDAVGDWHILDFKTNTVSELNIEETAAHYEMQMLVYALAAEKILKSPPRELTLHFLRTGQEKSFAWDAAARNRAVKLVEECERG
jgi:ATP-dependent helicase/nuclease subunit A